MHLEYDGQRRDGTLASGAGEHWPTIHALANTLVLERHWHWMYVRTAAAEICAQLYARACYRTRRLRELEEATPRPGDHPGGPTPWDVPSVP